MTQADAVYTVQMLSNIAGVSTRTLRYYDEIGLLHPARITEAGYRLYGRKEVDLLQQILFYREIGVPLKSIASILYDRAFDRRAALQAHRQTIARERKRLGALLHTIDQSLQEMEGETVMQDHEKFTGFKKSLIAENERKYGEEIREKYGVQSVEDSNARMLNMSEADYNAMQETEAQLKEKLAEAKALGDPASPLAQEACALHRQWLGYTLGARYSPETHRGLAEMYVADERFRAYYDKDGEGTAAFLRDAINIYTGGAQSNNP